jgi:hypothetical protein
MHIKKYKISDNFNDISIKRKISGTVNSEGTSRKSIAVFDRRTRNQLGSALAEDTGYWEIYLPIREDENLFIVCFDEGFNFNADIYDRVSLCSETFGELTNYENIIIKDEKLLSIINNPIRIVNDNTWLSALYDLTNFDGFTSSIISWNYRSYDQDFSVFSFKTGDTVWAECTNGDGVPGLTLGTSTINMDIQFKVVFNSSGNLTEGIFLEFEIS